MRDHCRTDGFFFEHSEGTFGIGASLGRLYVLLKGWLTPHSPELRTQLDENGGTRTFTVIRGGVTLVSVTYCPRPCSGFFWWEDEEDVDGFLWMHNVLSNSERCTIFIKAHG